MGGGQQQPRNRRNHSISRLAIIDDDDLGGVTWHRSPPSRLCVWSRVLGAEQPRSCCLPRPPQLWRGVPCAARSVTGRLAGVWGVCWSCPDFGCEANTRGVNGRMPDAPLAVFSWRNCRKKNAGRMPDAMPDATLRRLLRIALRELPQRYTNIAVPSMWLR